MQGYYKKLKGKSRELDLGGSYKYLAMPGSVAITSSGDIKNSIKHVIHAVGANNSEGSPLKVTFGERGVQRIQRAMIENIFQSIIDYNKKQENKQDKIWSVGIPSLGTGVFAHKQEDAAKLFAETLRDFIAELSTDNQEHMPLNIRLSIPDLSKKNDGDAKREAYFRALDELVTASEKEKSQ